MIDFSPSRFGTPLSTIFPNRLPIPISVDEWDLMKKCLEKLEGYNSSGECIIRYGGDWYLTDEDEAMIRAVCDRIREGFLQTFGEVTEEGINSETPIKGSPAEWTVEITNHQVAKLRGFDMKVSDLEPDADGNLRLEIDVRQRVKPGNRRPGRFHPMMPMSFRERISKTLDEWP